MKGRGEGAWGNPATLLPLSAQNRFYGPTGAPHDRSKGMTYSKANADQERRIGGPLIDVAQVLHDIAEALDEADATPGDLLDDFLQLVSLLAPEPGHHMLAANKARTAAQEWLEAYGQAQP